MPYNKTMRYEELEKLAEQAARNLYTALKQSEIFFDKVISFADGRNPAAIAAAFFVQDDKIDQKIFPDADALAVAIGDISDVATTLKGILDSIDAADLNAMEKFA